MRDDLSPQDKAVIDKAWLRHVAAGPDPADFVEAYIRSLQGKWHPETSDAVISATYANLREFWRVARDAYAPRLSAKPKPQLPS